LWLIQISSPSKWPDPLGDRRKKSAALAALFW